MMGVYFSVYSLYKNDFFTASLTQGVEIAAGESFLSTWQLRLVFVCQDLSQVQFSNAECPQNIQSFISCGSLFRSLQGNSQTCFWRSFTRWLKYEHVFHPPTTELLIFMWVRTDHDLSYFLKTTPLLLSAPLCMNMPGFVMLQAFQHTTKPRLWYWCGSNRSK